MQIIRSGRKSAGFVEAGEGEPAILLHSSGYCHSQWKSTIDALSSEFRMISPDLLGYGETGPWSGDHLTLTDEVAHLDMLIRTIGEPVHLVGHSYGGGVALRAAYEIGSRLRSLVLVEPTAFHLLNQDHTEDASLFEEASRLARETIDAVEEGNLDLAAQVFVDYWNGAGRWSLLARDKRSRIRARMVKIAFDFRALFGESVPISSYRRIKVPTLVLAGTHSPTPARALSRIVARALPSCRHRTVSFAGHLLPLTHKDVFHKYLREHLNQDHEWTVRRRAA